MNPHKVPCFRYDPAVTMKAVMEMKSLLIALYIAIDLMFSCRLLISSPYSSILLNHS
jgi:hypothetical protein